MFSLLSGWDYNRILGKIIKGVKLLGLGTCTLAKGAVHEIQGTVLILTGTVAFVGLCIVNTLNTFRQKPPPPPNG